MKILCVKKYIVTIWVLLTALVFSAVGMTIVDLANSQRTKSQQPTTEAASSNWSGLGTESNPYLITSKTDIELLNLNVIGGEPYFDTYFKLTCDLDYSGESFVPIGAYMVGSTYYGYKSFGGIFDGDGHIISNLNTTVTAFKYQSGFWDDAVNLGFFACLGAKDGEEYSDPNTNGFYEYTKTATVKNLKIKNFTINSSIDSNTLPYYVNIGGICGASVTKYHQFTFSSGSYDSTKSEFTLRYPVNIECCVTENLNFTSKSKFSHIGGLIGCEFSRNESSESAMSLYQYLSITHCIVSGMSVSSPSGSLISTISPAFGLAGSSSTIQLGESTFMFFHNIKYCLAYEDTYTTIMGKGGYSYVYDICNLNLSPSEPYYGNYAGSVNYETIRDVFAGSYSDMAKDYFVARDVADSRLSSTTRPWFCVSGDNVSYYSDWVYLKIFLEEVSFGVNDATKGSAVIYDRWDEYSYDEIKSCDGGMFAPRGEEPVINGEELQVFKFPLSAKSYIYDIKVYKNEGVNFQSWSTEEEDYTFTAMLGSSSYTLTFNTISGLDRDGNSTYVVNPGASLTVVITSYGRTGVIKSCEIRFTPQGSSEQVAVKYTISDNLKYISEVKVNTTTFMGTSGYTVNSNTTVTLTLSNKTYDTQFG